MTERTWIDPRCTREGWKPGPWDGEPDKVQWKDEATGLPCLAKRHPESGHWCGYVGVDPSHPWHGKSYSDLPGYPEVHGGLTYADDCQEGPPETTVCHIPEPGEPEHLWWFGFDCHHSQDRSPQDAIWDEKYHGTCWRDGTYKALGYVKANCARLARQIATQTCDE